MKTLIILLLILILFNLFFIQKDNFVNLGPNIKIFKSGKPNNLVTESKCRQIASSIGKPYGAGSWPGDPKGCFIENNNSKVWYNRRSTNHNCGHRNYNCLQPNVDLASNNKPNKILNESKCKQVASSTGRGFGAGSWPGDPSGCYMDNRKIWYNRRNTNHNCGHRGYICLQGKHNQVTIPDIKIFKSGKPNKLVSEKKCKNLASQMGKPYAAGSWPGDPSGCFIENNNSKVWYNRRNTSHNCGHRNYNCLQPKITVDNSKKPNKLIDETQCRKFASTLGKPYGAGSWPGDPSGCFIESNMNKIWYNRRDTGHNCGYRNYNCLQPDVAINKSGKPNKLINENQCKQIAIDSKKSFTPGAWQGDPSGCIIHDNMGKIWYNRRNTNHNCGHRSYNCIELHLPELENSSSSNIKDGSSYSKLNCSKSNNELTNMNSKTSELLL